MKSSGFAALFPLTLLLAGCAPTSSISEEEYLRNLSIDTSVDQTEPMSVIVSVDSGVQDPELWERVRISLILPDDERSLLESTSVLGAGGSAIRVPVDSVPGLDLSAVNVQVEYAVYRGEPTDGVMLFSGFVGIETEHSLRDPDDLPSESSSDPQADSDL